MAALDALLENVFTHTPDGTALRVTVEAGVDGGGTVVVEDAGPGLPSLAPEPRGRSAAGSTGLGLDIARRAAQSGGGALHLAASELGGAQVRLTLGAPA